MTSMNQARLAFVAVILAVVAFAGYALGQVNTANVMEAAPAAQSDVVCIKEEGGDEICQTPQGWLAIFEALKSLFDDDASAGDAPATPAAEATAPAADSGMVMTSDWTPEQKCEWLRMNFPQTTAQVQALGAKLANVPTERIATHIYHCDSETSVFDGFIVLGPNEGFSGAVTLTVPQNGAIDSYPVECGARYSEIPTLINRMPQNCDNTMRAINGTVTAQRMTYWPWNDDVEHTVSSVVPAAAETPVAAPTVAAPAPTVAAPAPTAAPTEPAIECVHPTEIAAKIGAKDVEWADEKYGGRRIEVTKAVELPLGWAGTASGRNIEENDTNRTLVPGFWSVYPPRACRAQWGYEQ